MELVHLFIILAIIFVPSTFFHCIVAMIILGGNDTEMPLFFNPVDLYKHTKLNWVGVVLVYLLCFVFCPIFVIGGLLKRNTK